MPVYLSPYAIGSAIGADRLGYGQIRRGGHPSNSRYRERTTPTRSVKVKETTTNEKADGREELDQTSGKRKGMCWAQRLKRVFNIDVSVFNNCGGPMKTTRPGSLPVLRIRL